MYSSRELFRDARRIVLASLVLIIGSAVFQLTANAIARHQPQSPLPTTQVQVGGETLTVELATTEAQIERGLMFRRTLTANQGMLFVYANAQERTFWMKNTSLPLAIAFLDDAGRIIHIAEMQPYDQSLTPSQGLARYALEVHTGWFAAHRVQIGTMVTGVPGGKQAEMEGSVRR